MPLIPMPALEVPYAAPIAAIGSAPTGRGGGTDWRRSSALVSRIWLARDSRLRRPRQSRRRARRRDRARSTSSGQSADFIFASSPPCRSNLPRRRCSSQPPSSLVPLPSCPSSPRSRSTPSSAARPLTRFLPMSPRFSSSASSPTSWASRRRSSCSSWASSGLPRASSTCPSACKFFQTCLLSSADGCCVAPSHTQSSTPSSHP